MNRAALLAALLMTAGLGVPLADAASARCRAAKVEGPASGSDAARAQAQKAPVLKVTDAQTPSRPLTASYQQPAGVLPFYIDGGFVFRTVQVVSRSPKAHLWVRAEFPARTVDVDMYAADAGGSSVAKSTAANNEALDPAFAVAGFPTDGGVGFELMKAVPVQRCGALSVYTASSVAPLGAPVRLTLWLGPAA